MVGSAAGAALAVLGRVDEGAHGARPGLAVRVRSTRAAHGAQRNGAGVLVRALAARPQTLTVLGDRGLRHARSVEILHAVLSHLYRAGRGVRPGLSPGFGPSARITTGVPAGIARERAMFARPFR